MKLRIRTGFTLVELLVVMAIIGILVGLLLPAVNAAREAARKATCVKNLGELSMALVAYDSRKQHFPGYKNALLTSSSSVPLDVAWVTPILPDLSRNDLYERIVANNTPLDAVFGADLEITTCPNDPPITLGSGRLSYIANCGLQGSDSTFAGVFNDLGKGKTIQQQSRVSTAFIASKDGVANTVLLSEHPVEFKRANGKAGCLGNVNRTWERVNAGTCLDNIVGFWLEDLKDPQDVRPDSKHPDGTHYAFADGHVLFLSDDVDLKTLQKLMTPEGNYTGTGAPANTTDIPWPQTALNAAQLER